LRDEVLDGGEARADLERTGRTLADLDVHLDELVGAATLGRDHDVLEEAERGDAALGDLEVRVVEHLAFRDLHLAADHLVASLGVTANVDALEVRALSTRDLEGQVDAAVREIDLGQRQDVRVRVALVLIEARQLLAILGDHRAREPHAGAQRDALGILRGGADQIALEVDGADREDRALVDGDREVHVLLVAREPELRRADLDVRVAAIPVVRADEQQVALERFLAIDARVVQEAQRVLATRRDRSAQLVVGDRVVADELNLADLDLGLLVDVEPHVDLGLVHGLDLVIDRREVEALLDVEIRDLLAVLLHLADVDDRVELEIEHLIDLVEAHLAVARDEDLANGRLLFDRERQDNAAGWCDLGLDIDVGEEAHLPHRAQILAELRGVEQRAGLAEELHADRIVLDLAIAAELHALDGTALQRDTTGGHRRRRGRRRRRRLCPDDAHGEHRDRDGANETNHEAAPSSLFDS